MLLHYFYDSKLAHASYLVGCQATGEAIIVDPGREIDIYLEEAARNDMHVIAATETHIHADFVSGARELAERVNATLYLSDEGDDNWKYQYLEPYAHQLLKDGDIFRVGNIKFQVMHTPGHTPEHISMILTDLGGGASEPMGVFTGDFVFVGSVGRPDLLEKAAGIANTSIAGARQMFRSLQRFRQLPDYLQVWPGHGAGSACGKGLGAVPSSTVGYEKLFNPMLGYDDRQEDAFISDLLEGQPEPPRYFAVMKRVNKEGPNVLGKIQLPPKQPASALPDLVAQGEQIIDTRPTETFAARHIAGTINIPADELPQWAGWIVDYERPLYLLTEADHIRQETRDLAYIGIDSVAGYFSFDEAVQQQAAQVEQYRMASAEELKEQVLSGEVLLLDVRNQNEWDEGHLPNAHHLMLGYLRQQGEAFINGKEIVVQCRTGNRSAIGASILRAMGARRVTNMRGGIVEWAAAGLPIDTSDPS